MSTHVVRRAGAALAGGALLAAGLATVAPAPHAAAAPIAPEASAVAWLESQLDEADLLGAPDNLTDTIDLGIGLARTGLAPDVLARVRSGVDAALAAYLGPSDTPSRVAKAAAFYALVGDPDGPSGDLDEKLDAAIDETGRLTPSFGDADYYNQSSAVVALHAVDPDGVDTAAATDFLIGGQCPADGGWGYTYPEGEETVCVADADTTALALVALAPQQDDPDVAQAIADGVAYLADQQAADGSFGLTDFTPNNTNSTGLAAWALAQVGETERAQAAATWIRARQVAGFACDNGASGEAGAIAYDNDALSAARAGGITDGTRPQWLSASAQAFPALTLAPAATEGLGLSVPRFVKASSTVTLRTGGLAPGQRACASLAGTRVNLIGGVRDAIGIKVPAGTKAYTGVVKVPGNQATVRMTALAARTLPVVVRRSTVAARGTQVVRVTGLVNGERVLVRYGTTIVADGLADSSGTFRASFGVGRIKGTKTVVARGQFDTRRGSVTFRVR